MDTYSYSLRQRVYRESASYRKRRMVKYFQFPPRPMTQSKPVEDDDQTDLFMFRTNTRLSFRPFLTTPHSRYEREINSLSTTSKTQPTNIECVFCVFDVVDDANATLCGRPI
eukprot:sb/3477022/